MYGPTSRPGRRRANQKPSVTAGLKCRAGNVSECVDHRQHDKAESKRDAYVGDRPSADLVDDDCTRPRKNQRERSEKFGKAAFHLPERICKWRLRQNT